MFIAGTIIDFYDNYLIVCSCSLIKFCNFWISGNNYLIVYSYSLIKLFNFWISGYNYLIV